MIQQGMIAVKPINKRSFLLLVASAALVAAKGGSKADQDIMAQMNVWKEAMLKRDAATLEKILHPDLTYSHSSGNTETKSRSDSGRDKRTQRHRGD